MTFQEKFTFKKKVEKWWFVETTVFLKSASFFFPSFCGDKTTVLFCLFCTLLDHSVCNYSHICKKHAELHTLRIQIGHFQIVRHKSLRVTRSIKVLSLTPASVSGYKPGFAKNRSIWKTASEKYQPWASLKTRIDRALNNPCPESYSFSKWNKLINKPLKGSRPPQLPNP